ncbi:MAG: hypothetical protein WD077_12255 [Bacteroidia bacterium]
MKLCGLSVLVLLFVINSCNDVKQTNTGVMVLNKTTEIWNLEIYENPTKIDADGNVQCANYSRRKITGNTFDVWAHSLQSVLSILLETKKNFIVINNAVPIKFLEIHYYSKDSSVPWDKKWLLQQIIETYDLDIDTSYRTTEVFKLIIADTAKLNNALAPDQTIQGYIQKGNNLTMPGSTLSTLTNELNSIVSQLILSDVIDNEVYSFKIRVNSISSIQSDLEEMYGLALVKDTMVIPYYKVDHNESYETP